MSYRPDGALSAILLGLAAIEGREDPAGRDSARRDGSGRTCPEIETLAKEVAGNSSSGRDVWTGSRPAQMSLASALAARCGGAMIVRPELDLADGGLPLAGRALTALAAAIEIGRPCVWVVSPEAAFSLSHFLEGGPLVEPGSRRARLSAIYEIRIDGETTVIEPAPLSGARRGLRRSVVSWLPGFPLAPHHLGTVAGAGPMPSAIAALPIYRSWRSGGVEIELRGEGSPFIELFRPRHPVVEQERPAWDLNHIGFATREIEKEMRRWQALGWRQATPLREVPFWEDERHRLVFLRREASLGFSIELMEFGDRMRRA